MKTDAYSRRFAAKKRIKGNDAKVQLIQNSAELLNSSTILINSVKFILFEIITTNKKQIAEEKIHGKSNCLG